MMQVAMIQRPMKSGISCDRRKRRSRGGETKTWLSMTSTASLSRKGVTALLTGLAVLYVHIAARVTQQSQ